MAEVKGPDTADKCRASAPKRQPVDLRTSADGDAKPGVPSWLAPRYPFTMAQTHFLSQAAYDRLEAEHKHLTTEWRIDIARKIEVAREMGDLKENGDYHAAKEEQGKTEARIRHLEALLEIAQIVDDNEVSDTVTGGAVVSIVYDDDDDPEKYLIGSIEEKRPDVDVISPNSPLGEALMGAKIGDEVSFEAPGGTLTVTIVDIEG